MALRGLRCVVLAALLLGVAHVAAQAPAATPESDTARAVRYARSLEASPDRADAMALRQWLTKWTLETPDYLVNVCDVLDLQTDEPAPHGGELFVQQMFGNVAYQIEHGAQHDELSKQTAAAESALRAYAAFVAKDARAATPRLDAWVAKRDAGTLRAHLAPIVNRKCLGKDEAEQASASPFLGGFLRESHVVYPLKVGSWQAQGEHRYDDQAAGASIRFQRPGDKRGWIDVYFYPVGVLTEEKASTFASMERQTLLATWGKAMASPQDMSALSTFTMQKPATDAAIVEFDPTADDLTAHALDFAYSHEGKAFNSAMVVVVHRLYAIKFRYSAEAATLARDRVRQDLEGFARDMLPRLDITSTGSCWSPTAVHTLPKGAAAPEGALATAKIDGEVVTWVMRDRLVVRDLAQLDASISQAQAMSIQGRLYEGCTGANPVQPAVQDGMRELRFEYRAGETAPTARPLRAKRSGTG